ncbi:SapC family protein [Gilvimarinus agarilyticus]|uniref:SapC family protein n=1 Tax=Gilvimarinus agarilyticus TaxID=679259 RepID=UPI0005A10648|nr:SapC family protein [Gilvimarinus agarilyticus]
MTKQLMIYNDIQALSSEKHRNMSVKIDSYDFIDEMTSSPLLATEIPFAAAEYAVIFSAPNAEGEHTPLAVMGVKQGENLMLSDDGSINARYVPAFVRRYPFVFAGGNESENLTLCIDEKSKALHADGSRGERLFDDNGEQTEHLKDVIKFLQDYQYRAEMTKAFCKKLKELDLLEPMQANIEFNGKAENNMSIKGFYTVKREKLKELGDEQVLDLFKKDGLELIYAHLQSLSNLNRLVELKNAKLAN